MIRVVPPSKPGGKTLIICDTWREADEAGLGRIVNLERLKGNYEIKVRENEDLELG